MPTTLVLNPLTPPTGTCIPGNAEALLAFTAQYLQIVQKSATGVTTTIAFGSSTPDISDQDKPWYRTTTAGIGLGIWVFYNGKWIRTGPFSVGDIINFNGPSSAFDSTGKGIQGTETDSWLIANGNNGTPDLRNRFVVGGQFYTSAWLTNVDNTSPNSIIGGRQFITINKGNLPELTASFGASNAAGTSTQAFVRGSTQSGAKIVEQITFGDNNVIYTVPPYYALGFKMWNPFIY